MTQIVLYNKGLESDPFKATLAQKHFTTFLDFPRIQKYLLF